MSQPVAQKQGLEPVAVEPVAEKRGFESLAEKQGFEFAQLEPVAPPEPAPRLDDARAQAAAIIAAAEADAQGIRDAARAEGYQDGYTGGRHAAAQELEPAASALAGAVEAMRQLSAHAAETVEREAVGLALSIAEKIVQASLGARPELIVEVVRGALRAVVERERIVVGVNPADLELVRGALDELSSSLGGIGYIEVQEERRVGRGGTVVRTAVGEIDASVESKLERARAALEAELRWA